MIEPVVEQAARTELLADALFDALVRLLGFALLAFGTAGTAAALFRWYSADELAEGIGILIGVTAVAVWLNTKTALQDAILGTTPLLETETAIYTVAAFVGSAIAADGGRRIGDRLARSAFAGVAPGTIDDVGQLVRSVGRVIAVELPESIEDADGHDPVDAATKAALAGQTLRFPRGLTVDQLRDRLATRLERDYGVGHVDVDLAADGEVEYLALGSRPTGIGPTLAPGSVAVAVRGDPAADAAPGDAVRIWARAGDDYRRVADGELRGTAADVATVALDREDARALGSDADHRLVTLPETPDAERELVSALRAADETVAAVPVDAGSALEGAAVGSLPALVLAIERDGDVLALPGEEDRLAAGDVAHVLGRPDALRRLPER